MKEASSDIVISNSEVSVHTPAPSPPEVAGEAFQASEIQASVVTLKGQTESKLHGAFTVSGVTGLPSPRLTASEREQRTRTWAASLGINGDDAFIYDELGRKFSHIVHQTARYYGDRDVKQTRDIRAASWGAMNYAVRDFDPEGGEDFIVYAYRIVKLCVDAWLNSVGHERTASGAKNIIQSAGIGHRVHKYGMPLTINADANTHFTEWCHHCSIPGGNRDERLLAATIHFTPSVADYVDATRNTYPANFFTRLHALCSFINRLLATYDPANHGEDFWAYAQPQIVRHDEEKATGEGELADNDRRLRFQLWADGKQLDGETVFQRQGFLIKACYPWMLQLRDALLSGKDSTGLDIAMLRDAGYNMLKVLVSHFDPDPGIHGESFQSWAEPYICAGILRCINARKLVIPRRIYGQEAPAFLAVILKGDLEADRGSAGFQELLAAENHTIATQTTGQPIDDSF